MLKSLLEPTRNGTTRQFPTAVTVANVSQKHFHSNRRRIHELFRMKRRTRPAPNVPSSLEIDGGRALSPALSFGSGCLLPRCGASNSFQQSRFVLKPAVPGELYFATAVVCGRVCPWHLRLRRSIGDGCWPTPCLLSLDYLETKSDLISSKAGVR